QRLRGSLGEAGASWLELAGQISGWAGGLRSPFGVPRHDHGRASARRRRLPRDGDRTATSRLTPDVVSNGGQARNIVLGSSEILADLMGSPRRRRRESDRQTGGKQFAGVPGDLRG